MVKIVMRCHLVGARWIRLNGATYGLHHAQGVPTTPLSLRAVLTQGVPANSNAVATGAAPRARAAAPAHASIRLHSAQVLREVRSGVRRPRSSESISQSRRVDIDTA